MTTDTENMLDIALDSDLNLILSSWDADHCESTHESLRNQHCDHIPVAICHCTECGTSFKGCQSQVRYFLSLFQGNVIHNKCGRLVKEVWKVIPL